ncbi:hypothetical protein HY994_03140 [Candidatus Micrarchaeota archaeon]|nr:hypothetical protein [Candidatus Micrarchaeota archaeon]
MAFDVLGSILFLATGQALAWAFLPKFGPPEKIGAGILASLTVPALVSAVLNYFGVPFNPVSAYLVFLLLLGVGAYRLWSMRLASSTLSIKDVRHRK